MFRWCDQFSSHVILQIYDEPSSADVGTSRFDFSNVSSWAKLQPNADEVSSVLRAASTKRCPVIARVTAFLDSM